MQKISGRQYGELLNNLFFNPLGMSQTRANDYQAIFTGRAAGYAFAAGRLQNKDYYSVANTFSAGVLLSSVAELARWDQALTARRALPPAVQQLMWRPQPSASGNERAHHFSMGLGWFLVDLADGRRFQGHNGHILGFSSAYMRFPAIGLSVILLCNSDAVSAPHQLALAIAEHVRDSGDSHG